MQTYQLDLSPWTVTVTGWVEVKHNSSASAHPTIEDIERSMEHESDIDPCDSGDHYHCDMPSEVGWKPDTQTISVKCCCGTFSRNQESEDTMNTALLERKTWFPVEDYTSDNTGPTPWVIKEGDPINGPIIGNYSDLGTAHYKCRLHNQHESLNYALNEVQAMYQSEIHFGLIGFWDGGIEWYLGIDYPGDTVVGETRGNEETVEEAIVALTNAARRRYPESAYASGRACDIALVADQRTTEDLSYELHQAIGPFELYFDTTDPDPYAPRWTLTPKDPASLGLDEGVDAMGGYSATEVLRDALSASTPQSKDRR